MGDLHGLDLRRFERLLQRVHAALVGDAKIDDLLFLLARPLRPKCYSTLIRAFCII